MTEEEAKQLPLGLFRLWWKTGGFSLAAVGQDDKGRRWFAPVNWLSVPAVGKWRLVEVAERICSHLENTK